MTMVFMMVIELDDFPIEDGDFPWLCWFYPSFASEKIERVIGYIYNWLTRPIFTGYSPSVLVGIDQLYICWGVA